MKNLFIKLWLAIAFCISFSSTDLFAQADLTWGNMRTSFISVDITDFGANPNDNLDDTWAFIKLSKWLNNEWNKSGVPYSTGTATSSDHIDYTLNYVVVNLPASTNGGAYLVGKEIQPSNVNGVNYSYPNHTTYSAVFIPYSAIFLGAVPASNTEGINVGILQEYTNHGSNPLGGPYISPSGPILYSTVYWQSLSILSVNINGSTQPDGIWFKGELNTIIRKNNGMHLGYWDKDGNKFLSTNNSWDGPPNQTNNLWYQNGYWGLQQNGGSHFFYLENVINVKFTNIEIDGNKQTILIGGLHPTESIQSGSIGIFLQNTKQITVEDMNIHHTSFDGIIVTDNNWQSSSTKFECKNTQLKYNGRTAFAWISGKEFSFDHVDFNYSGKDDDNTPSGYGNPNCGIDLEPDVSSQSCVDGTFTNCNFIGNLGPAISCNTNSEYVENITFDHCTMWKGDGYGLICRGKKITYDTCNIYCPILYFGGWGTNYATKFNGCYFEDRNNPLNPSQTWGPYNLQSGSESPCRFLIQTSDGSNPSGQSTGTEFNTCHFKVNGDSREMFKIFTKNVGTTPVDEYTTFNNCDFNYANNGVTSGVSPSYLSGILFKGNTLIQNTNTLSSSKHEWSMSTIEIEGNTASCSPNIFDVDGNIVLSQKGWTPNVLLFGRNGNGSDGFLKATFNNNALLHFANNISEPTAGNMTIGENSLVEFNSSSSILAHGYTWYYPYGYQFGLYGQLVIHSGAYFTFHDFKIYKNYLNPQKSLFYIDANAVGDLSPFWYAPPNPSIPLMSGYDPIYAPCVQGGNANLPNNVVTCSPTFNNVTINGTMTILYNIIDNVCNGGNSGSITFQSNGNIGTMSYTLSNGATTTGNSFTGLSANTYTLVATDAACASNTVSIIFVIAEPATAVSFNSPTIVNVTCNGGNDGTINISATGGSGTSYIYTLGSSSNSIGVFNSLAANTYTIQVADANGCTATTTITITQPSPITFSNPTFFNVDCFNSAGSITTLATGGTGTIASYSIAPNIGTQNTPGNFNSLTANTYTITATDAVGCTGSTTVIINAPTTDHCCSTNAAAIITGTPNLILVNNISASTLINLYNNSNSTFIGKYLYIDGTLTVDADITFNGCTLWFTQSGYVLLNPTYNLDIINGSLLQASCDWWGGIGASYSSNKVSINGSTVQQMGAGVFISNNAELDAINSTFINNDNQSILFSDMTNNVFSGKIWGNTFIGSQGLVPYSGIQIYNCKNIVVGSTGGNGNHFENLNNGIDIEGFSTISNVLSSASNLMEIYNSTFSNIQSTTLATISLAFLNDIYQSNSGAAIFIDYSTASNFGSSVIVNNVTLPSTESVLNCTKAIISKNCNLTATNLYIHNTPFGIMNYNLFAKTVNVHNNKIEQTTIGTQLAGYYKDYLIDLNDITLSEGIGVSNAGYGLMALMYPPIGIDIKQNNQVYDATQNHIIDHNTINIPQYAGTGIANMGANKSQKITNNSILFTLPTGILPPSIPYSDPSLFGIFNRNSKAMEINNNLVDGQYSLNSYNATYSKAFYFETSKDMKIYCNKARATKQGLYAWGDNFTDKQNITHNKFKYNLNPLYCLDNGNPQPGTFGNIGNGSNDNNNDWLYYMGTNKTWLQNSQYKVWRQSNVQSLYWIYTIANLLIPNESGSPNANQYKYQVVNSVSPANDACPDANFGNTVAPQPIYNVGGDISNDELIALQNETYINFLEVGEWINHRWLYDKLERDEDLRNSSSILLNFYNNYKNTTIANIEMTDLAMGVLFNFEGSDYDLMSLYNDAIDRNMDIVSSDSWEINEREINAILLRAARYGMDSVSEMQKFEIDVLANTCPFVGGSAVYKARVLNTFLNPLAQYNDRLNCVQSATQNKGSSNGYTNIDSLYESEANIAGATLSGNFEIRPNGRNVLQTSSAEQDDILIYPNPAEDYLNIINLQSTGEFELLNPIGQVDFRTKISQILPTHHIVLPDLKPGVYTYKLITANTQYFGKLTIVK